MKKLILLSIILIVGCSTWNKILPKPNITFQIGHINSGSTKEEVIDLLGEPVLSELYYNVDEFHYCKSGRFKDAYVVLFFIDNKLISKEQFLGNMIIDDIKNVKHIGNCASFIKNQDYKIPPKVQAILDKNTPTPPELKEPKEPIEPEKGVVPTVPDVNIPVQTTPTETEEDE